MIKKELKLSGPLIRKRCVRPSLAQMPGRTNGGMVWTDPVRTDPSSSSDRDEWIPEAEGQWKYTERSSWSSRHSAASDRTAAAAACRCTSALKGPQRPLAAGRGNAGPEFRGNPPFLTSQCTFKSDTVIFFFFFSKNEATKMSPFNSITL